MRMLFRQLGGSILVIIVAGCLFVVFFNLYPTIGQDAAPKNIDVDVQDNENLSEKDKPILVVQGGIINLNELFDYKNYVKAYDKTGKDISSYIIVMKGSVDTRKRGVYTISYKCKYDGVASYKDATYIVD